jgi:hypothetical protein
MFSGCFPANCLPVAGDEQEYEWMTDWLMKGNILLITKFENLNRSIVLIVLKSNKRTSIALSDKMLNTMADH